jgi:hypothetical protein
MNQGKRMEMDKSNIGGHVMDLAENGSEDGTSTPTKKDHGAVPAGPTLKVAGMILPAPSLVDAGTTCQLQPAKRPV